MGLRHTIKFAQMTLRLIPKILDPVDMIFGICEGFRMVDPVVLEIADIENIIATPAVRINDAIGQNFAGHDRHECLGSSLSILDTYSIF